MTVIGEDEMLAALGNALAVCQEHDDVDERLARFNMDAAGVAAVLNDRWEAYSAELDEQGVEYDELTMVMFLRAYLEGLITMRQLLTTCAT